MSYETILGLGERAIEKLEECLKEKQDLINGFIDKLEEYQAFEYNEDDPAFRCLDDLFAEDIKEYKKRLKDNGLL